MSGINEPKNYDIDHITKKRGRKLKYTNDEDRYKAKLEQTRICTRNYYRAKNKERSELKAEIRLEKIINLFFEKIAKLNTDKKELCNKIITRIEQGLIF